MPPIATGVHKGTAFGWWETASALTGMLRMLNGQDWCLIAAFLLLEWIRMKTVPLSQKNIDILFWTTSLLVILLALKEFRILTGYVNVEEPGKVKLSSSKMPFTLGIWWSLLLSCIILVSHSQMEWKTISFWQCRCSRQLKLAPRIWKWPLRWFEFLLSSFPGDSELKRRRTVDCRSLFQNLQYQWILGWTGVGGKELPEENGRAGWTNKWRSFH